MASPNISPCTLSVVIPTYNEEDILEEFHRRLLMVLDQLDLVSEIIYVNDGSTDSSLNQLRNLHAMDPRVAVLNLSRNFGKEIAMSAGLDHARGDAVVLIDADLQDPPELIPEFIKVWQQGHDVVYGQRTERLGESAAKRTTAFAFYRLARYLTEIEIPHDTGDFRLLSRRAVTALNGFRERHRFMKGIFSWIGFTQIAVPYQRAPRERGKSKWGYWKLWNLAIEGITSFSIAPLKIATYLGLAVSGFAFVMAIWITTKTLLFGEIVRGYPTMMITMLLLGGTQLIAIGIIGEYVGRIFNETKRRPLYLVDYFIPPGAELVSKQRPTE